MVEMYFNFLNSESDSENEFDEEIARYATLILISKLSKSDYLKQEETWKIRPKKQIFR